MGCDISGCQNFPGSGAAAPQGDRVHGQLTGTTGLVHVRWLSLILILGSTCVGCTSTHEDAESAYLFLIDDLPDSFPAFALATCSAEQDGSRGSIAAYAGTEQIDTEEYMGTPRLTLSVFGKGNDSALPRDTVDELVSGGDPNSSFVVDVAGHPAVGFTMSSAEPRLTPWPAVTWETDDIVFVLLGRGMNRDDVMAAANSVRAVDREEFESAGRRNAELC